MKLNKIKKTIKIFEKKFSFLKENNIKIKLTSNFKIPAYFNTYDINNKYIAISIEFAQYNNRQILEQIIRHEFAHVLDYLIHDGWRKINDEIIYHDSIFEQCCKLVNAKQITFINQPKYFINDHPW